MLKLGSLFDGLYTIDEQGNLYSNRTGKYLRPSHDRYGYAYYTISINGVRQSIKAHRLVAEAFIPNPEGKPTVNHINGVRDDNRVCNLEWATHKEQMYDPRTRKAYMERMANFDYQAMGARRNFGRRETLVYDGDAFLGRYASLQAAAIAHKVNYSKASECANGHRNHTGGLRFVYASA